MEATNHIPLKSLEPYRHLFPLATGIDHTVKKGAGVSDTVDFMSEAADRSRWMVRAFVKQELKGLPLYDACNKLWHFVKEHIRYEKDQSGVEQVKSARRLIADGSGDCDCMTNFVNACMLEYGIKGRIINRIAAYDGNDYFQHIYSLIPSGNGQYIIMDCVWNGFNTEKKYTNKKDKAMDLQFLDGIDSEYDSDFDIPKYNNIDAQDVFGNNDVLIELGRILRRKSSGGNNSGSSRRGIFKPRNAEKRQARRENRGRTGKKTGRVFNKINRVNPATALLRAGMLASMKLNLMKVAQSLRWGYASPEVAKARGMDMAKYLQIKKLLTKTQKAFYTMGGNVDNLRKAILNGMGNPHHEVAGMSEWTENSPVSRLLGATLYREELQQDMEGFAGFGSLESPQGLGEPATAAAITAASGAIAAIAVALKNIGPLFPNKGKQKGGSDDSGNADESSLDPSTGEEESNAANFENDAPMQPEQEEQQDSPSGDDSQSSESSVDSNEGDPYAKEGENNTGLTPGETDNSTEITKDDESTEGLGGIGTTIKAYYQSNKKWIKPTVVVAGVGTLLYFLYKSSKKNSEQTKLPIQRPHEASPQGMEGHKQSTKEPHKETAKKPARHYERVHPPTRKRLIRLM